MKQTICWGCQNYSKCSWAIGIPVKGWDATPTQKSDYKSYCVHSCPQYLAEKKTKGKCYRIRENYK